MKNFRYFSALLVLIACFSTEGFSRSTSPRPSRLSNHPFCGAYPGRIFDELRKAKAVRQVLELRRSPLALRTNSLATGDVGNIAIIEDDGTIVSQANPFDLADTNLKMTPNGPGAYALSFQVGSVNQKFGTKLALTDDDFREIAFPTGFQFPFMGTKYGSVFINSDGNITFTQGDSAHTDRDLSRFNGGVPRIAALFDDLDPTLGDGSVYYNILPDRFLITWNLIREFEGILPNTVQLALFPDGSFEITFGSVGATSLIVGWTAGQNLQTINLTDLSKSSGALPSGPVAENFSDQTKIDYAALAKRFYQTHPDDYDQLAFYTNFPYDIGADTFAFEATIKNDINGINVDIFDYSQEFGSGGRLQSFLSLNQLAAFPDNPDEIAVRTYSPVAVLAHETAHRWLAYPLFKLGTTNSGDLLGYQQAHWSYFFNADASLMEGHVIRDNGNGSFTITEATNRFGKLDQYLMGLRGAADVGPLFYVKPSAGSGHDATDVTHLSDIGLTFNGTRTDLTVNDIIAAEGPRSPDVVSAPKGIHQASILLVRSGTSPTAAELEKLSRMQQHLQEFFSQATEGLGTVDTRLNSTPIVPIISAVSPASGSTLGNTTVYISGSNLQAGATVTFGSISAADIQIVSPSLIIATTGPGPAGAVNLTVTNPGAQSATLTHAYTYRALAPVTIPATALRIPYAVDNLYFRSNLGINNPNPLEANVRISELDNNGLLVNQPVSATVSANGFLQINSLLAYLEGSAAPTGREGSLVLESDQPIHGFVSQIDNQTGDPSILDGTQTGGMRLILQSAANTGPFRSTLVILNLSPGQALVDVTALSRSTGQPIGNSLRNVSIAGHGFISFNNILQALSVPGEYGPVEIHSTNGTLLAAVSRVSGLSASTSGFFTAQDSNSGSQSEIIPFVIDTDTFRTNLGLNNLSGTVANVQIALFDQDGNTRASTASPIQVAPQGMVQINGILRFLINGSSNSGLTNQQGYLRITSDQPIKAFATQIHNVSQDPSIENSVSAGSSHLLLKSSANLTFQSTLVIVNPNNSPVTATIRSRQGETNGNGNITATQSIDIAAKGYFESENILQSLGATSNFGPIEILSAPGSPLIAVSRVYSVTGDTSGFFNAEPLP